MKSALTFLLQSHIPSASGRYGIHCTISISCGDNNLTSCRDIDEIVLTYVISILEDLVEESDPSQAFDSDSFMEMIVAYLPLLEGVDVSSLIS